MEKSRETSNSLEFNFVHIMCSITVPFWYVSG